MSPAIYKKLQTIIRNNPYDTKTGTKLFYNKQGPTTMDGTDNIYIDCQPVGQSEETVQTESSSDDTGSPNPIAEFFDDPLGSPFFILIIVVLVGLGLFLLSRMVISQITPSYHKIKTSTTPSSVFKSN
jgi:hypothetical protein